MDGYARRGRESRRLHRLVAARIGRQVDVVLDEKPLRSIKRTYAAQLSLPIFDRATDHA